MIEFCLLSFFILSGVEGFFTSKTSFFAAKYEKFHQRMSFSAGGQKSACKGNIRYYNKTKGCLFIISTFM